MLKKLTSLLLVCALSVCSVGNLGYAATNEETARKIAAIFAEQEEKSQRKFNLESGKRQKLEDENKALLEELKKLKAEKYNKELQNEIEKLKTSSKKTSSPSVWSSIKTWFRNITGLVLGVTAAAGTVLGLGAGIAGIWSVVTAVLDCNADSKCQSFLEKMTKERFLNSFGSIKDFLLEVMRHIDIHAMFVKEADK